MHLHYLHRPAGKQSVQSSCFHCDSGHFLASWSSLQRQQRHTQDTNTKWRVQIVRSFHETRLWCFISGILYVVLTFFFFTSTLAASVVGVLGVQSVCDDCIALWLHTAPSEADVRISFPHLRTVTRALHSSGLTFHTVKCWKRQCNRVHTEGHSWRTAVANGASSGTKPQFVVCSSHTAALALESVTDLGQLVMWEGDTLLPKDLPTKDILEDNSWDVLSTQCVVFTQLRRRHPCVHRRISACRDTCFSHSVFIPPISFRCCCCCCCCHHCHSCHDHVTSWLGVVLHAVSPSGFASWWAR